MFPYERAISDMSRDYLLAISGREIEFQEDFEYGLSCDLEKDFKEKVSEVTKIEEVGNINETVVIPKGTRAEIIVYESVSPNTKKSCVYVDVKIKDIILPEMLTEYMDKIYLVDLGG